MCSILVLNAFESQELPRWLLERIPPAEETEELRNKLAQSGTKILCNITRCPNLLECYARGVLAFQILAETCPRKCSFCSVPEGLPWKVDETEVKKIAQAVKELDLTKVVLASAPRDDLIFGGAGFFSRAIAYLKNELAVEIEANIPDFQGSSEALKKVVDARPDIINHSVETVRRLYSKVCPKADYNCSLRLLAEVKELDHNIITKSGFMLGLGETDADVLKLMEDLRQVDCDLLTIGQYISPSGSHFPVHGFVLPNQFKEWEVVGRGMGFKGIASAPLVRSSYQVDFKKSYNVIR